MTAPPPTLLVCDGISWRLDLFEQALDRVFGLVAPFEPRVELGYRSRDDLALIVVHPTEAPAPGFATSLVFEARLPGFRQLEVAATGPSPAAIARRTLDHADVVVRVPTAAEAVAVLRGRLGMLSDARAAVRLRVAAPLRFDWDGQWIDASTSDMTANGVFVSTDRLPPLGTVLRLELFSRSHRGPVAARAVVVRHTPNGFGARLVLSPEAQGEVYRRVRAHRLPPPAPRATVDRLAPRTRAAPSPPAVGHVLSHAISETLSHPSARAVVAVADDARRLALCTAMQGVGFETLRATTLDDMLSILLEELLALSLLTLDHGLDPEAVERMLKQIREAGGETHLPIAVLTADADAAPRLKAAGADLVLSDALPIDRVVAELQALLERGRHEALG